jgi:hypothetical protein
LLDDAAGFHIQRVEDDQIRIGLADLQQLRAEVGIAGIEQAEEFEDDKQFQIIRDRLRQENGSPVRPLVVIANANGHNWIHSLWMAGAHCEEIDS